MEQPTVLNWFDNYLGAKPHKARLARPDHDQPALTEHQNELIAYVMNDLAVEDKFTEARQRELIAAQIRSISPAGFALAEIQRQMANLRDALPGALISEMQNVLARLHKALDQQEAPEQYVDDVLLFLRGLRLIDEVMTASHDYLEKAQYSESRLSTLNVIQKAEPDHFAWLQQGLPDYLKSADELQRMLANLRTGKANMVNKINTYNAKVVAHKYNMAYVKTYVDKGFESLSNKTMALQQISSRYEQALQDELRVLENVLQPQTREHPQDEKARLARKRSLSENFATQLRL